MFTREAMRNLTQEIVGSYEARAAGLALLRGEVTGQRQAAQAQLKELGRTHQALARRQRSDLTQTEARRKSEVNAWLKDVAAAHQAMARHQRADLGKGRAGLTQADARRRSEVNAWMKDVAAAHAGVREAWQGLAETMQAKRSGAVAVAEAAGGKGETTAELEALSQRVFEFLADHPDGTRLAQLQAELGMNRFEAARVIRHLITEGKAEKRDLLYFAT